MATIFDRFATSLRKHADYRRTVAAIRSMPLSVARDFDIFRDDAQRIARTAVYGA